MSRKVRTKLCKECGKEIRSSFPKVFCNSSCAAKFNNKVRKENGWRRTQESLARTSGSLKEYYMKHPDKKGLAIERLKQGATASAKKRHGRWLDSMATVNNGWKGSRLELDITNRELLSYRATHTSCEICGKKETATTIDGSRPIALSADHDHANGKFRGLLCRRCNKALGWYESHKDDIAEYMNKK